MKKYGKKLLGLLLCAVLIAGLLPGSLARAEEETDTDTEIVDLEVTQKDAVYGETLEDPVWSTIEQYDVLTEVEPEIEISYSGKTAAGTAYGPDSKKPTEAGS